MASIGEYLGVRKATPHNFSKATPVACPDAQLLYGVELEIESANTRWQVGGMDVKEDHSLRNGGLEFVTNPMTYSNLAFCLNNFFEKVDGATYSERTSVHVHTNVHDLTFEQLSTVTLIYQTFENVLFSFIGEDREKNIFCVPWSQTTLTHDVINNIKKGNYPTLKKWQKYTALNLLPMFSIGTIEWRHMAGTQDKERILLWCRIIGRIFAWARTHSFDDTQKLLMGLNSTSHYRGALSEIFLEESGALQVPDFEQLLEDGVLQMKYAMLNVSPQKTKKAVFLDEYMEDIDEEEAGVTPPPTGVWAPARPVEAQNTVAQPENPFLALAADLRAQNDREARIRAEVARIQAEIATRNRR